MKSIFLAILTVAATTLTATAVDPVTHTNYLKALNSGEFDSMGEKIAISGDTMVVGAPFEQGSKPGVNPPSDNSLEGAGAAYVFVRQGGLWIQQAYLKASNPGEVELFGTSVAISGDTIVVGANNENSSTTGINSTPNEAANDSGAAYVFVRDGNTWTQQAYLKASNTGAGDRFGTAVGISADTAVITADYEDSGATVINGSQGDNSATLAGAAYVFIRSGAVWTQQAYLKASNTQAVDVFGRSAAISGDTIVVGAYLEDSSATGVDGNQSDNGASGSGAAYVFTRIAGIWSQQAYLKASNTGMNDQFGSVVAISGDTIGVAAPGEAGTNSGVNPPSSEGTMQAGAAYIFVRTAGVWSQQAYIKAGVTGASDFFGGSIAVAGDALVVGSYNDDSAAAGVNGNAGDNSLSNAGAAWYYTRSGVTWTQQAYLKASNPGDNNMFGYSVAVSSDTVMVGANGEEGSGKGTNPAANESANFAGAVYAFETPITVASLAHSGYSAPGGVDLAFGKLGTAAIGSGGILFDTALSGGGAPAAKNQGVFSTLGGSPGVVLALQKGTATGGVLGLPANARIASLLSPVANGSTLGFFQATVSGTGLGAANNRVLFQDDGDAVSAVFRTGTDTAGLSGSRLKTMHEVLQHRTLSRMVIPYTLASGSLPGSAVTAATDSGLLELNPDGTISSALAREGLGAFGGGGDFGQFTPRAAAERHAQTWFIAKFIATGGTAKDAVFDTVSRVSVLSGDPQPAFGPTAKMGSYLAVSASSNRGVFRSTLTGVPSAVNEALWHAASGVGGINLLLQKGALLPESATLKLAKIIRYWPVGTTQVVAHVQISGTGVTASNNTALILVQDDGDAQFLLRTGDTSPGYAPGVKIKTLSSIEVDPVFGHYAVLAALSGISSAGNQALLCGETSVGDDDTQEAQRLPRRVLRKGGIYTTPFTPVGSIKGILLNPAVDTSGASGRGLRQVIDSSGNIVVTITGDRGSSELVLLEP